MTHPTPTRPTPTRPTLTRPRFPTLLLGTALAAVSVLTAPALADPALADPAAGVAHYASEVADCDGRRLRLDLARDTGAEPNLRVFWRIDDGPAQGRDWHLPAEGLDGGSGGEPVILDMLAGHPKARVDELGGPAPRITLLGYDRSPVAGCPEITLSRMDRPLERYRALLDAPDTIGEVTPARMADWLAQAAALPPALMLANLDRATLPRALAERRQALLDGLARHAGAVPSDEPVAMEALVEGLRALWIADPRGDQAVTVLDLARAAQARRAIAAMAAGDGDGSGAGADGSMPAQADTTCRIMALAGRSMMARDHVRVGADALLELASGQPLIAWTPATADAQLAEARRCAAPAHADLLAREWPRIAARAGAIAPLLAWAEDRATLPATLTAQDAASWLTDAPALATAAGVSRAEAAELTGALTEPLVDAAAESLGAELAQGIEALTDPEAILAYCRARIVATRAPVGAPLAEAALSACEARAAVPLRAAVEAVIARDLAALEATPETLDGLLATNGYALAPRVDAWLRRSDAAEALAPLRATLTDARAAMAARRDAVIAAETRALDARIAALDPARDDRDALPDCVVYDRGTRWTAPLLGRCRQARASFEARRTEIRCQRLFAAAEAPEALQAAQIDLGGGETVALRILACEWGLEAALDARGGLFSKPQHQLTLQIGTDGAPLALTGRLQAPEAGASGGDAGNIPWRLTGITVTPGRLAEGLDPDAPATLHRCLCDPASCTE